MQLGLNARRIAILATDGVEHLELTVPRQMFQEAGAEVDVIGVHPGDLQTWDASTPGERVAVNRVLDGARPGDYVGLLIPGGLVAADALRTDARAVRFVREFLEADKPVAVSGHGAWLLVEADAVRGRSLATAPGLKTDIENAGGTWVDRPVEVDQKLITGRGGNDLTQFCARVLTDFANRLDETAVDQLSEQSFPASDPPPGPISVGHVDGAADTR